MNGNGVSAASPNGVNPHFSSASIGPLLDALEREINVYIDAGDDQTGDWLLTLYTRFNLLEETFTKELRKIEGLTTEPERPARWLLADLYARPDLLEPPNAIVGRIAWKNRSTLLAAREKRGKSTLLGYIAAEASNGGSVFGVPCEPVDVLLIGLEEFVGDIARRYKHFGANPERIHIVEKLSANPVARIEDLRRHIHETGAALVILDTFMAYVSGGVKDTSSAAQVQPFIESLTRVARETGAALVIVGHGNKATGGYRDTTALGAAVDVIIEIQDDAADPLLRHVKVRGRVPTADFDYRYDNGKFVLVASTDSPVVHDLQGTLLSIRVEDAALAQRIVDIVSVHPGATMRALRDRVAGRSVDISRVLSSLIDSGRIINRGSTSAHKYYVHDAPELEFGAVPAVPPLGNRGQEPVPTGNRSGTGAEPLSEPHSEAPEGGSHHRKVVGNRSAQHTEAA